MKKIYHSRAIKRPSEIKILRKAAKITVDIFKKVRGKVKPGRSEQDIRDALEYEMRSLGLERSFTTIVASGPNGALPHAKVSNRTIRENDMVVMDFGIVYKGFHSDMSRTVVVGRPNNRLREIYRVVSREQKRAIKRVKHGVRICGLARDTHDSIRKLGLGKHILHTLGHGVGRKIHEAPKLSERNKRFLKEGMVITIEPGLYIMNMGGARIEDMVLVTKKGQEVLTR